jgi:hypothetical protein
MEGPTTRQLDLFRIVEDVHELTDAIVVLITDGEGRSVAVSGDENEIPAPLRAVLGGAAYARAGTLAALLEPVAEDLAGHRLNFTIRAVAGEHLLTIAFDAEADFGKVQLVANEAKEMIDEILTT